jgi:hypothetical protein
MRATCAVALLVLLAAGCGRGKPDTPVPEPKTVAARPATPAARTRAAAPATPRTAPAAAPARAARAPAAPPLDLKALTQRLRDTKAIGIFTKITLKNQVDDLLDGFRDHYQGKAKLGMTDLRRAFDLLMMKVLSLLQDEDRVLASAIVSSREAIWGLLADPKKFAILDV